MEYKDLFDYQKPTAQMLGRWQPWHDGHSALFKKALAVTGQVCIMVRDVGGIVGKDAGGGRTAASRAHRCRQHRSRSQAARAPWDRGFSRWEQTHIWVDT